MIIKEHILLYSLFCLVFVSIGCSNKIRISGRVTFPEGEPVTIGEVCFESVKSTYRGRLDQDGYYFLGEFQDGDGVPPGNYTVWLSGTIVLEEILNKNGEATDRIKSTETVSRKYTSSHPDSLKFDVKRGGPKTFDFSVERPVKVISKTKK